MSLSSVIYITRNYPILRKNVDKTRKDSRSYLDETQTYFNQKRMIFRMNNITEDRLK
jgi:hypothetical protein